MKKKEDDSLCRKDTGMQLKALFHLPDFPLLHAASLRTDPVRYWTEVQRLLRILFN